jgi:hypothetical protein
MIHDAAVTVAPSTMAAAVKRIMRCFHIQSGVAPAAWRRRRRYDRMTIRQPRWIEESFCAGLGPEKRRKGGGAKSPGMTINVGPSGIGTCRTLRSYLRLIPVRKRGLMPTFVFCASVQDCR